MKSIITRTCHTSIDEHSMIVAVAQPDLHNTHADAVANVAAMEELAQGQQYTLLLDLRQLKSQDRDARHLYNDASNQPAALAIVVESPVGRLTGNLIITLKRPIFPAKLFTDPNKAKIWLRQQSSSEQVLAAG